MSGKFYDNLNFFSKNSKVPEPLPEKVEPRGSIFKFWGNDNTDIEEQKQPKEEPGYFSTFKSKINGARDLITGQSNSGASMKYFLMFLGVAALFFALSILFLPMVYLFPYKFALLFTLGSINVIVALAFYHGPLAYLKVMFS